jgi:hypothetical protein
MRIPGDWIWHIVAIVLMITIVIVNHLIAYRRAERRLTLETQRLRAALAAELQVLQELYQTNLRLIEEKANYVLSTRSPLLICKGNLGRLTSLFEETVIEQLVDLFAHNEMMEAHIAARADPRAGISYRFAPDTKIEPIAQMYADAARNLERARDVLDRLEAGKSSALPRLWPRKIQEIEPDEPVARYSPPKIVDARATGG